MGGEAWWATVHMVAKSRTWLSTFIYSKKSLLYFHKWDQFIFFFGSDSYGQNIALETYKYMLKMKQLL